MVAKALRADAMASEDLARTLARLLNGTKFEMVTATASTNGNATWAHGLGAAPTFYACGITGDTTVIADVQAVSSTLVTFRFKAGADGSDVTSGSFTVWVIVSTTINALDF